MKPSSAQVLESSYAGSLESTSQERRNSTGNLVSFPPNNGTGDFISFPPCAALQTETTDHHEDFEDVTLSMYSPEDGPISLQVSSILNQSRGAADRRNRNRELQMEMNFSGVCDHANLRSSYDAHIYNMSFKYMQDAHSNFSSLGINSTGYNNNIQQGSAPRRASIISTTSHDSSSFIEQESNFAPPALSNFRSHTINRSREDQIRLDNAYAV